MIKVSLKEAEGQLGELIEGAAAGQEVVIMSNKMDAALCASARSALIAAGGATTKAIRLARGGMGRAALNAWQALVGTLFPLS